MTILFIAPLPPPVTGHSLVSKVLHDELARTNNVQTVDLSKGGRSANRVIEIALILQEILKKKKTADRIYFTISESFGGNFKDLLIYLICFSKLPQSYIHLHGGSIKRLLWDRMPLIHKLNKLFLKKVAGVIISGNSHKEIFADVVKRDKVYIVPNFAPSELFTDTHTVKEKFQNLSVIKVLYMSSMREMKGYRKLLNAYLSLPEKEKEKIQIDFAGNFETSAAQQEFCQCIAPYHNLNYHGLVSDEQKKKLFADSHVFCLPSRYLEGQPISILEAYAAGCVVLTTTPPGVLDIFTPGENGYAIDRNDITASLIQVLKKLIEAGPFELMKIADHNITIAKDKYQEKNYTSSIKKIMHLT